MARFMYQDIVRDGNGKLIESVTVTVYLAGTTTLAKIYSTSVSVVIPGSVVTSDSNGIYKFWVDDSDYGSTQAFKLVFTKTGYDVSTHDNLPIFSSTASGSYYTIAQVDALLLAKESIASNLSDMTAATVRSNISVYSTTETDTRIGTLAPLKTNNLSDVTAGTARTNLSVYSKTEVDAAIAAIVVGTGFLAKTQNLADLNNAGTARSNLGVYSTTQTDSLVTGKLAVASNLSDLGDATTARSNLGVYSTAQITTLLSAKLTAASNLGDLTDTTQARTNLGVYSSAQTYTSTQVDTLLGAKVTRANNLNDLSNNAQARTNIGLGSMAVQNANGVAITGGTISGITDLAIADGGTGASTALAARLALKAMPAFNVKDYGAIGDNSHDDTSNIQAAYADATAAGARLFFPAGTYKITSAISLNGGFNIKGDGIGVSVINQVSNASALYVGPVGTVFFGEISDMSILCTSAVRNLTVGIQIDTTTAAFDRFHFHDLHIGAAYVGIYLAGTHSMQWGRIESVIFDNGNTANSPHYPIYCDPTANFNSKVMHNVIFVDGTGIGLYFPGGGSGALGDFQINDNDFYGGSYGIYMDGTGLSYNANFNISDNKFDGVTQPITLRSCSAFRVLGNTYLGGVPDCVQLVSCSSYLVDDFGTGHGYGLFTTDGFGVGLGNGAAHFALDGTQAPGVSIGNNATLDVFGAVNNFSGMILVQAASSGFSTTACFMATGATTYFIGGDSGLFSVTVNTPGKTNCYYSGGGSIVFQNLTGASRDYAIMGFRLKPTAA